jgi:hypothetical protein
MFLSQSTLMYTKFRGLAILTSSIMLKDILCICNEKVLPAAKTPSKILCTLQNAQYLR